VTVIDYNMTYYEDNIPYYDNIFEDNDTLDVDVDVDIYACNESSNEFQLNAMIAKSTEAQLVSLMIIGFFIIFNTLLYKSVTKIISLQREQIVKYQLISEYYMNQYGVPELVNPFDTDAIFKHIIDNEEKDDITIDDGNTRILRSHKKVETNSLNIKGNGWKLE
jgi:hypothetical protein